MSTDHTQRFTTRAGVYAACRPTYPPTVLDVLRAECGLAPQHVIADVGAGTGLLTEVFARGGYRVYGVEPNAAMRAEAEAALAGCAGYTSLPSRAEATGLADGSVDFITVASALHWFDPAPTQAEFRRILRPGGVLVIAYNRRDAEAGGFSAAFDAIRNDYGAHSPELKARRGDEALKTWFGHADWRRAVLPNPQEHDWDGVVGLMRSYSTIPDKGQSGYEEWLARLRAAFDQHAVEGRVTVAHACGLSYGPMV